MAKLRPLALITFLYNSVISLPFFAQSNPPVDNPTLYSVEVRKADGKLISLEEYKGKVFVIVNVASECGYTSQYKDLQKVYEQYHDEGLEILAFPCNDFGGQEPGSNDEIKSFCETNFGVSFTLFDKVKILGKKKEPLYEILTNNSISGTSEIKWNFEKFIISRSGKIVKRFKSGVKPMSDEFISVLEEELGKEFGRVLEEK